MRDIIRWTIPLRGGGAWPGAGLGPLCIWICLLMDEPASSIKAEYSWMCFHFPISAAEGLLFDLLVQSQLHALLKHHLLPSKACKGWSWLGPSAGRKPSSELLRRPSPTHSGAPLADPEMLLFPPVCGSSEMNKLLSCRKKQSARECLHVAEGSAVCGMFMQVGGGCFGLFFSF